MTNQPPRPSGRLLGGSPASDQPQPEPQSEPDDDRFLPPHLRGRPAQDDSYQLLLVPLLAGVRHLVNQAARKAQVTALVGAIEPLPDTWEEVQAGRAAVEDLRRLGPEAEPAIPALVRVMAFPPPFDPQLQMGASLALINLGEPAIGPVLAALAERDTQVVAGAAEYRNADLVAMAAACSQDAGAKRLIAVLEAEPESQAGRNAAYVLSIQARGQLTFGSREEPIKVLVSVIARNALKPHLDSHDEDLAAAAALAFPDE